MQRRDALQCVSTEKYKIRFVKANRIFFMESFPTQSIHFVGI